MEDFGEFAELGPGELMETDQLVWYLDESGGRVLQRPAAAEGGLGPDGFRENGRYRRGLRVRGRLCRVLAGGQADHE